MNRILATVLVAVLALAAFGNAQDATDNGNVEILTITDFEGAHCRVRSHEIVAPPLYGYEAFYGGEGNRSTASCQCMPAPMDPQVQGGVARLEYSVVRPRTYAGFWLKWVVPGFNVEDWDALCFDIRGCDASSPADCDPCPVDSPYFSSTIKVELKIDGWGWRTAYVDNVASTWTRVRIPLEWFDDTTWEYSASRNEFVITLEEHVATVDRGVYYIDNIFLERTLDE